MDEERTRPNGEVSSPTVLVAYASRHGSTKGVAERIAGRLEERGSRVDLLPVGQVGGVEPYDGVVFGSPVYNGAWLPEGEELVRANLGALAERPVWLFSVGSFGDRKRVVGPLMTREPRGIGGVCESIQPRDYRVFAGVIDRHQWPFFARLFLRALGGRLGDNRDWKDIDAWSVGIARALRPKALSMPGQEGACTLG